MHLTLLTCNYNTPNLIDNLLKSTKHFTCGFDIFVVDTGKEQSYFNANIHIADCSHGEAVNKAFDQISSDYVLLVDSDVIFYKDINYIFKKFKKSGAALLGNVSGDRGGKRLHPRVDPWFCLINLKILKEKGIKFFDPIRTKESRKSEVLYDIGSTMFEDVIREDLTIINFNGENDYFKHYEGMSWRTGKFNPHQEDTDIDFGGTHNNRSLYEYGRMVAQEYIKENL